MTTLAHVPSAGSALETYAEDLRQLGADLRDAVEAATDAARAWGAALENVNDDDTRRLGTAAVQRGLDRYVQLDAVLARMGDARARESVGKALEQAMANMRRQHHALNVSLVTSRAVPDVDLVSALAAEVATLVAVSNTVRHAPAGTATTVDISAQASDRYVVTIRELGRDFAGGTAAFPLGQGSRLALWLCSLAGGSMSRHVAQQGVVVTIRLPVTCQRAPSSAGFEEVSRLEELHRISAGIQATHGFAQPLLEARWLADGDAGAQLSAGLRQLTTVGDQHRQRLGDQERLQAEIIAILAGAGVPAEPLARECAAHPVDQVAAWAAAQARYRLVATAETVAARLGAAGRSALVGVEPPQVVNCGRGPVLQTRLTLAPDTAHDLLGAPALAALGVDVVHVPTGVLVEIPIEDGAITS